MDQSLLSFSCMQGRNTGSSVLGGGSTNTIPFLDTNMLGSMGDPVGENGKNSLPRPGPQPHTPPRQMGVLPSSGPSATRHQAMKERVNMSSSTPTVHGTAGPTPLGSPTAHFPKKFVSASHAQLHLQQVPESISEVSDEMDSDEDLTDPFIQSEQEYV